MFGLSVYGPDKVNFTKVLDNPQEGVSLGPMLVNTILNKALSEGADEWKQVGKSGIFSQFYSNFEHSNIGYGFYAFRNESNRNIQVTITLTKMLNIKSGKPHQISTELTIQ